jgi:FkbM family methyltransferase
MFNQFLGRLFRFIAYRSQSIANFFLPPPPPPPPPIKTERDIAHDKWLHDQGDKTLRLNYPLYSNSVVLDVGGFEGQWASDIYSRYLAVIHIFEPIPHYAQAIAARFSANKQITIHPVGLSDETRTIEFHVNGDASSSIVNSEEKITSQVIAFDEWCDQYQIQEIALLKINIEGGEYALLEHILNTGRIKYIYDLQVQFHDFFTEASQRMKAIQSELAKTHYLTYQYPFVWENWRLKDNVE